MSSTEANATDFDHDLETPSDHGEVEVDVAESDEDGNGSRASENTGKSIHNGREFYN